MRITIILAISALYATIFLSSCNFALAQTDQDLPVVSDPGSVEVGESLIAPDSPLFFLKTLRESIEVLISATPESKINRELEFAQRRLREVNSLVKRKKQHLVPQTLGKYRLHLDRVQNLSSPHENLTVVVAEAVARHLDVLQRVYDQVGNPAAKISIRETIEKAEQHNRLLIEKLGLIQQQKLIKSIASRQAFACAFLQRESTASGLTDEDKKALREKVAQCRQNIRQYLKDELEDVHKKSQTIP